MLSFSVTYNHVQTSPRSEIPKNKKQGVSMNMTTPICN